MYTKGEWRINKDYPQKGDLVIFSDAPNGSPRSICKLTIPSTGYRVETETNAHLISASPDLYEACKEVESLIRQRLPYCGNHLELITKALAKAEGK